MLSFINGVNLTNLIDLHDLQVDVVMKDPMSKASVKVLDKGSQFIIPSMASAVFVDENGVSNPTHNLILDPLFANGLHGINDTPGLVQPYPPNNSYGNWSETALANHIVVTPPLSIALLGPSTGDQYIYQLTQLGAVAVGQEYCFSVYIDIPSALSGSSAFIEMDFYGPGGGIPDASGSLGSVTQSFTSTSGRQRVAIFGTAPAGSVYIGVAVGMHQLINTGSGSVQVDTPQLEPVWLPLEQSYPTPDCNSSQSFCTVLPDGTTVRQTRVFAGFVNKANRTYRGSTRIWTLECANMSDFFSSTYVNQAWSNIYDNQIIEQIFSQFFTNIFTTHNVVQGSLIDQRAFGNRSIDEVLSNLCDNSGFTYYVDPYLDLHYEPPYYLSAPFNITDSNDPDNVVNLNGQDYEYCEDFTQRCNDARVVGGNYLSEPITDTFSTNGSTTTFTLSQIPNTITGNALVVNGTNENVGWSGVNSYTQSPGYAALIHKTAQQLVFHTAPASGSCTLTYQYLAPVYLEELHLASIAEYGRGVGLTFARVLTDSSITSTAEAATRAIGELVEYAFPRIIITFKVNQFLAQGQSIKITSVRDNLTAQPFMVQTVKFQYLGNGLPSYEVTAGAYNPDLVQYLKYIADNATSDAIEDQIQAAIIDIMAEEEGFFSDAEPVATPEPNTIHVTYGDYFSTVQADEPQAYYHFDETSGTTANDSSGNSYNGTYSSTGITYNQPGAIVGSADAAVLFDGVAGEMTCPSSLNPSTWTALSVEAWVKFSSIPGSACRIVDNNSTGANKGFALYFTANAATLNFSVGNSATHALATYTGSFTAGVWYHLVGTWDGTTVTLYLNGVSVATASLSGGSLGSVATSIGFGYNIAGSGGFFPGDFDESAVYDIAVSAARVLAHYTKGLSGFIPKYGYCQWS